MNFIIIEYSTPALCVTVIRSLRRSGQRIVGVKLDMKQREAVAPTLAAVSAVWGTIGPMHAGTCTRITCPADAAWRGAELWLNADVLQGPGVPVQAAGMLTPAQAAVRPSSTPTRS